MLGNSENFQKLGGAPPSVYVKYDCSTQMAILRIEWNGNAVQCVMARMLVDTNKIYKECIWKLELMDINATRKVLQSNVKVLDMKQSEVEVMDVDELEVEKFDSEESELQKFDEALGKKMII